MDNFLTAIGSDNFYKGDASEHINLIGNGEHTTAFAVVDEESITQVMLSMIMRYSPDQIRMHLFSLNQKTNLLKAADVATSLRKDMNEVDILVASGEEGDHGFIQIESISVLTNTLNLVARLREFYTCVLLPACSPAKPLVKQRVDAIRKHTAAATWSEVQKDIAFVLDNMDITGYRELMFICLDGVDTEDEELIDLLRIIYAIREYAGCNVIFVTSDEIAADSALFELIDTSIHNDEITLPVASDSTIIACLEKNKELCAEMCTSEWR